MTKEEIQETIAAGSAEAQAVLKELTKVVELAIEKEIPMLVLMADTPSREEDNEGAFILNACNPKTLSLMVCEACKKNSRLAKAIGMGFAQFLMETSQSKPSVYVPNNQRGN